MSRTITLAPVRKSIQVKASQAHAFKVFTSGNWWPKTHTLLKSPLVSVIEPRVGGRWYERGEDGSECNWGRVLAWEPPSRLLLTWQISGAFKADPNVMTEVEVKFIAEGAKLTRVELEHRNFEGSGDTAEALHTAVGNPTGGWGAVLSAFVVAAEAA